jgi:predicted CXXCH cytochrome family protein
MMRKLGKVLIPVAAVAAVGILVPHLGTAQQPGYKGSKVCLMCHNNMNKDIAASIPNTGHSNALWEADQPDPALKRVILGDFAANPGFDKAQVKWVLGWGISFQAYLDADYHVLPKWWDVEAKAWKPLTMELMQDGKLVTVAAGIDARTACLGCHMTGYDPATAKATEPGVHCEACHGPGAAHAGSADKTKIVRPQTLPPDRLAMVCGQCHSAGADPSGKYAFPVDFKPGDDLTQKFTIYMVHGTDVGPAALFQQYSEWTHSAHAKNNVTCVSCHDPHGVGGQPHQLKQPVNDLCLSCHKGNIPKDAVHAPALKGTLKCNSCHMPGGSHLFQKPGA